MRIPLLDLKAEYMEIKDELKKAVDRVFESQQFIMGPEVKELERKIADYSGTEYAVAVASGTDAILLSLMAIGINPGDEVITTPYTFFATGGCIDRLGAVPVFVDINPETYNIDPEKIEKKITPKTKAIIPVHLYGQMCHMDRIMDIAKKHNLRVIEDAAQSIGATYKKKKSGSIGDTGCFSFYPSKNLGACGDGGMIVTNNKEIFEVLDILRNHGAKPKYYHSIVGCNSRLDTIQAAALLVKLNYLDKWTEERRKNAYYYNKKFNGSGIICPFEEEWNYSIYNQYIIRVKNRDKVINHLKENNIGFEIYYPVPLHLQECFKKLGYKKGSLINSEIAAEETLALPVYPSLSEEQKDYVANKILEFF